MSHCGRYRDMPLTRREMLKSSALGFGGLALSSLLNGKAFGATDSPYHHAPKAKAVIFLYMDGGPSHVDAFDPKPRLREESGKPFATKIEPTQFDNNGNTLGNLWDFKQYGESGIPVSDLFPHIGSCVDDITMIHSMTSKFSEHNQANYFLHTGHGLSGRPSMGAWTSYGLGAASENLPGYVVLNGGLIPSGGVDNFGSGFLPASFQGSVMQAIDPAVPNIKPKEATPELQQNKLALMNLLDGQTLDRMGNHDALESAIKNYELAYKMQSAVPELMDISGETDATKELYGLNDEYPQTAGYAMQCLVARRLVERGVRFIELTVSSIKGSDRWDAHGGLKENHTNNARAVDKPIAGLLKDLKSRGMLDETLVIFSGEFGRTPFAQGTNGRDHN
ncbi:MAG: DUF1501 domain-containing protein, partial [Candidatus Hydrogenedentota bacterium]